MPLNKQLVQLPFGGLQTKVDPKMAPLGTYSIIDNMIMNRFPELQKRNGIMPIGETTTPSNIYTSYNYLNEVGVITNNALYSYSPVLDEYQLKGQTASPIVSSKPIIANTYAQSVPDGASSANGIYGVIWEDSRGGVRGSIKDIDSDTFIYSDVLVSATGVKPKAIGSGNGLYFIWIEPGTTSLMLQHYDTIQNRLGTPQTIASNLASCYTFDVIGAFGYLLISYATTSSAPDVIRALFWDTRLQQIGSLANGVPDPASLGFVNSGTLPPALSLAVDPNNGYFICTLINNSHAVYTKAFYAYLTPINPETEAMTATSDPGWALGTCVDSDNNTYIFSSSKGSLHNSFQMLVSNNITTTNVVYARPFYLQLGVVSRSFFYSGNAYVVLGYDSELQNTYFGVRDDGACFARMLTTLGGGNIAKANCVAGFFPVPGSANTYILPLLKTTEIVSSANSFFSQASVFTEQIFFTPQTIDNKVLGNYLNIAGGYVKQYDGSQTVFEQSFHLYPEKPVAVQSTGGSIANGSYSYIVCWEWMDNQGQLHRSTPSIPTTITTTGSNGTVTLTVRALTITNKETRFANDRTPVILAVYRTQSLGTTYFRVNQLPSEYVYNDPTVQTLTFVDTYADTTIDSNSLLYTTGSVLENIALPATNLLTVGKNRVFVAGTDTQPNQLYFSKEKQNGIAVEFSAELTVIIDSLGGNITALAAMDDKVLIFKKSLVYYIAGALPDNLGNGTFPTPLLIAADCGCEYPQSVVLTGAGVMFQSQKGIYLVDRQLNLSYIGQSLDHITTNNPNFQITSAVNLPDQNQVFFTDAGGQVLVYDTYFQLWYTHTLPFTPVSSTILNNNWYVTSTASVFQGVPGRPTDANGQPVISRLKTNWISLAQMEGFSRIYSIMILGDNADLEHRLRVNLYYDFEEFPREQLSIIPDSLLGKGYGVQSPYGGFPFSPSGFLYGEAGVYGEEATYGGPSPGSSGVPYGGFFDGTYQFVIRPREQKCTSIMIEIFDEFSDGNHSESFRFSGLSIVAGMKSGWNRNLSYNKRLT